jgi:hypothetical protein
MAKRTKIEISLRALTQRINRRLAENDQVMKAARGERIQKAVGDFYIIDTKVNAVHAHRIDPETFGRKLGVLKEWEVLAD